MVGIEGIGGLTANQAGRRLAARTSSGFSLPAETDGARQTTATAAVPEASLASLLVVQEFYGERVEDRRARRHGQDMLAKLAELQRGLLAGGDQVAALERLAELAAAVPCATDRGLAAIISAIVLRVRIELARRQI